MEVIKTEKHVKYKLLLFDLDGTLCNTDEMVVQTFSSYMKITHQR